uniref:Dolichyl-diphosphooligosaccharide--protein glycosyltransferase subunit 1 n=1 Tax=Panagrolaimus sp. ES5 TaxID=591445 RepID=A0AC34F9R5_9BILA
MRAGLLVMFLLGMLYNKIPFSDVTVIISRSININPEFSIYVINIKAKNKGNDVSYFIHPISKEERQHLSHITAFEENGRIQLDVSQLEDSDGRRPGYVYYKIDFFSPLMKDSTLEFQIQYVLSEYWKSYPLQNKSQIVSWEGSLNYVSVYPIESDNTAVTIENAKILSCTGIKLNRNKIQYGPTEKIAPFTSIAS